MANVWRGNLVPTWHGAENAFLEVYFLELTQGQMWALSPARNHQLRAPDRSHTYRHPRRTSSTDPRPTMGSTVVGKKPAKVVTRLGRRGRRGDDADDGAGGSRHTPLNAAFAIVQAYE